MMTGKNNILLLLGLMVLITGPVAGNPQNGDTLSCTSMSTEKIMLLKSAWSGSSNAAVLSLINCGKRVAKAGMIYKNEQGYYKLFQEPEMSTRYGFYTNGFTSLGIWRFYGNFGYYNETGEKVRRVDVLEPAVNTPNTVGDSIGGNYWKEYYIMEGKSTVMLVRNVSAGVGIKYKGGVGTKRKDPRPLNTLTDFELSPGIIWTTGRFRLGAGFRMESGKEDIEFSSVNDRKYDLFYFRGLGAFTATTEEDGRYRETTLLGGGIQAGFTGKSLENYTDLHINRQTTDIKRGDTYPLQMVFLDSWSTEASSVFLIHPEGNNIKRLSLFYRHVRQYGQEPVVEPKLQEISWQWSTAAKYTLYWQKQSNYGLSYSYYKVRDPHHFFWGGSVTGKFVSDEITYYFVPEYNRQRIDQLYLDASFEKNFLTGKNQLVASLSSGYRTSPFHRLEVVADEKLREKVQLEFLEHDYDYQITGLWEAGVQLNYGREIQLSGFHFQWYVETGYKRVSADRTVRNLFQIQTGINF